MFESKWLCFFISLESFFFAFFAFLGISVCEVQHDFVTASPKGLADLDRNTTARSFQDMLSVLTAVDIQDIRVRPNHMTEIAQYPSAFTSFERRLGEGSVSTVV